MARKERASASSALADVAWMAGVATCVKLLLVPAYRSTDFEVHRNWLAITHSLPLSQWYRDATSQWTLDYPPLFALFERCLALLACRVDPLMTHLVNGLQHASYATVLFQRVSVMATDCLLAVAAWRCTRGLPSRAHRNVAAGAVVLSAGLLLVDHMHFQYNGMLLAMLLLSLSFLAEGRHVWASLTFACLCCFKHLFAVAGPFFLVFLLRHHCFPPPPPTTAPLTTACSTTNPSRRISAGTTKQSASALGSSIPLLASLTRIVTLGAVVLTVLAISFAPFIVTDQIPNLLARLFPFGRGLMHAYWAANFWALYTLADKLLAAAASAAGSVGGPGVGGKGGWTRGLVGDAVGFSVVPQVTPLASLLLVLAAMAPVLLHIWFRPFAYICSDDSDAAHRDGGERDGADKGGKEGKGSEPHGTPTGEQRRWSMQAIAAALAHVFLSAFLLGWHVHEKAVLHFLLPLSLLASSSPAWASEFLILATVSHYALLPLLFTLPEYPIKILLLSLFSLALLLSSLCIFSPTPNGQPTSSTHQPRPFQNSSNPQLPELQSPSWLHRLRVAHALGVLPLEMLCQLLYHHPRLHARFPFLPLLLTSVYCALGITVAWAVQLHAIVRSS